jgi:hypothetical protein
VLDENRVEGVDDTVISPETKPSTIVTEDGGSTETSQRVLCGAEEGFGDLILTDIVESNDGGVPHEVANELGHEIQESSQGGVGSGGQSIVDLKSTKGEAESDGNQNENNENRSPGESTGIEIEQSVRIVEDQIEVPTYVIDRTEALLPDVADELSSIPIPDQPTLSEEIDQTFPVVTEASSRSDNASLICDLPPHSPRPAIESDQMLVESHSHINAENPDSSGPDEEPARDMTPGSIPGQALVNLVEVMDESASHEAAAAQDRTESGGFNEADEMTEPEHLANDAGDVSGLIQPADLELESQLPDVIQEAILSGEGAVRSDGLPQSMKEDVQPTTAAAVIEKVSEHSAGAVGPAESGVAIAPIGQTGDQFTKAFGAADKELIGDTSSGGCARVGADERSASSEPAGIPQNAQEVAEDSIGDIVQTESDALEAHLSGVELGDNVVDSQEVIDGNDGREDEYEYEGEDEEKAKVAHAATDTIDESSKERLPPDSGLNVEFSIIVQTSADESSSVAMPSHVPENEPGIITGEEWSDRHRLVEIVPDPPHQIPPSEQNAPLVTSSLDVGTAEVCVLEVRSPDSKADISERESDPAMKNEHESTDELPMETEREQIPGPAPETEGEAGGYQNHSRQRKRNWNRSWNENRRLERRRNANRAECLDQHLNQDQKHNGKMT